MLKKSPVSPNKDLFVSAKANRKASYFSFGGGLLIPFLLWQNIFTYPAAVVPPIEDNAEHKFLSLVEPVKNSTSDVSTFSPSSSKRAINSSPLFNSE